MKKPITHEQYIARIAALASRAPGALTEDRATISALKLAYGAGPAGTLGVTYYRKWQKPGADVALPFVAICATCQPEGSHLLAETVLHELGHAIAPIGAGHGPLWADACARLGLVDAKATYKHGDRPLFSPYMATALARLAAPTEGSPVFDTPSLVPGLAPVAPIIRPCTAGDGTRGGKSRGPGSGSRNRLWLCQCAPAHKLRFAGIKRVRCEDCGQVFKPA